MIMQETTGGSYTLSLERSSISSSNYGSASEFPVVDYADGCTLLHLACEVADIIMLELLLQYGANVNAVDSRGDMPLHRCIVKGKSMNAKMLLAR